MNPRSRPEEFVGVVCMAVLVLITLVNVAVRYLTDESFAWTEELSVFLMVVMVLAGAASIAARDAHIRIEYFYDSGTPARRRLLRLVAASVTCLVFLVLAGLFARTLVDELRWAETLMGLGVPRWWLTVWLTPLCLLVAFRAGTAGWHAFRAPLSPGTPD